MEFKQGRCVTTGLGLFNILSYSLRMRDKKNKREYERKLKTQGGAAPVQKPGGGGGKEAGKSKVVPAPPGVPDVR